MSRSAIAWRIFQLDETTLIHRHVELNADLHPAAGRSRWRSSPRRSPPGTGSSRPGRRSAGGRPSGGRLRGSRCRSCMPRSLPTGCRRARDRPSSRPNWDSAAAARSRRPTRFSGGGPRPMIARSAVRRFSRSLRVLISCATMESYLACASLLSVIVETPTSKLRFACASCSEYGRLLALRQFDVELGEQHVEVRDRHAQDQVLLD